MLANAKGHTDLARVYLHVHSGNEEAIRFYTRGGFKADSTVSNYFPRLTPPDATIMSLAL